MDQADLEKLAEDAYTQASLDPEHPHVFRLARCLLGPRAIRKGPRPLHAPAALIRLGDEWQIFVGRSLPPTFLVFCVGHELAHWLLRREGFDGEDEERVADALGAALVSPRPAFRRAFRAVGDDLPALATALCTTETGAALRIGEVAKRPLAVIAPKQVRVRGPEDWVWPDENTLRCWSQRPRSGVRKRHLRDDPRRVVLEAQESAAMFG